TCAAVYALFSNDTPTTAIYPLSLHDALPISIQTAVVSLLMFCVIPMIVALTYNRNIDKIVPGSDRIRYPVLAGLSGVWFMMDSRSEEHTSELQSRENLVCRLLPEKKKNISMK